VLQRLPLAGDLVELAAQLGEPLVVLARLDDGGVQLRLAYADPLQLPLDPRDRLPRLSLRGTPPGRLVDGNWTMGGRIRRRVGVTARQ